MPQHGSGLRGFFSELRRRGVWRAAVIYAASAFLLIEGADLVAPALKLPAWVFTAVVMAALSACPSRWRSPGRLDPGQSPPERLNPLPQLARYEVAGSFAWQSSMPLPRWWLSKRLT